MQNAFDFADECKIPINRVWAMPNAETFSVPPIGAFVKKYLAQSKTSVDPFARNKRWATCTNDLDPNTAAEHHMDADVFLSGLRCAGAEFDLAIFDPPYSPRQIKEVYDSIGRAVTTEDTQSRVWSKWKDLLGWVIAPGGVVLSFGWNSSGLGKRRGFAMIEVLLVCHGGAHSDTICVAERKREG